MDVELFDWSDRSPTDACRVCGEESVKGGHLCRRCRRFSKRVGNGAGDFAKHAKVGRAARLEAMWSAWNPRTGAFVCAYTGMPLSDDPASRRYATWGHDADGSVVLVTDLVHRMKADMTPVEFRRMVRALARHYDGKPFDKRAFPSDPAKAA